MSQSREPRVVIIGAGFSGLWAARSLAGAPVQVELVDRNNYHTFFPLLYQVGAAELEAEDIAYPVRSILRKLPNVRFRMAEVKKIDLNLRRVETTAGDLPYDYLILALGSAAYFFGVPGASETAFGLKTVEQGISLRNHVLSCFEQAAQTSDTAKNGQALTFVIVGGGPTGVEFAGALAELVRGPLKRDYPDLAVKSRILLLEAMDQILQGQPAILQHYALKRLGEMGVEIHLNARVKEVTPTAVHLKDGSIIPTKTVVWTAGVRGEPSAGKWDLPLAPNGQVKVLPTLQVPDHPEVYVVGDLARVEAAGHPLPMIAPVAIQEGMAAARNIGRSVQGDAPLPFRYHDRGLLATIGRNAATAFLWGRTFTGRFAWLLWLGVHIYNLIGFRNRLIVLINWAWDYIFGERGVRLILPGIDESDLEAWEMHDSTPEPTRTDMRSKGK